MPPTDMPDFLEHVFAVLTPTADGEASAGVSEAQPAGLLEEPGPELRTVSRPFRECYGEGGDMLKLLADEAEAAGDAGFTATMRALAAGLADGTLQAPAAGPAAPRVSSFVYPVI